MLYCGQNCINEVLKYIYLHQQSNHEKLSSPLGLGLGLGLLLADSALTVGCGKTFWCVGRFSFYENDRNSETKSWKINPKVQYGPSLRALQTGRWHKLGSYGKNEFSVQKPSVRAQKKHSLHYSNHVLATTRQNCANKKVLFFPNKYQSFCKLQRGVS